MEVTFKKSFSSINSILGIPYRFIEASLAIIQPHFTESTIKPATVKKEENLDVVYFLSKASSH